MSDCKWGTLVVRADTSRLDQAMREMDATWPATEEERQAFYERLRVKIAEHFDAYLTGHWSPLAAEIAQEGALYSASRAAEAIVAFIAPVGETVRAFRAFNDMLWDWRRDHVRGVPWPRAPRKCEPVHLVHEGPYFYLNFGKPRSGSMCWVLYANPRKRGRVLIEYLDGTQAVVSWRRLWKCEEPTNGHDGR